MSCECKGAWGIGGCGENIGGVAKIERVLHNHCNAHCTLEQTSPQRFDALSDLRVENDTAHSSGTWSWRNPGAGRSQSGSGRGPGAAAGGGGRGVFVSLWSKERARSVI